MFGNRARRGWSRMTILAAVAPAVVFVTVSCSASAPSAAGDPQLELGRSMFAARCSACHGPSGAGAFGPKLSEGAVVKKYPDPADQRAVVANGRGNMPKWSSILSADEIDAVVRYTREKL